MKFQAAIACNKSGRLRRLFTRFEDARLFIRLVWRNSILHKSVINSVESVLRVAPLTVQIHVQGSCTYAMNTCVRDYRPRGDTVRFLFLFHHFSLSLPSSITLCLSFSFSRPTGVRRHNNCDTYRMHSFRVGNVSLDVATFASANAGGETLLPHFAITTLTLYSFTLAIYTRIYTRVCTCGDTATYCAIRTHVYTRMHIGAEGPTALLEILPTG